MAQCYHRKLAYLVEGKGIFFKPRVGATTVTIPCGKCAACRVNNAAQWATRAMHESLYCETGSFVTLTYDPEHCPRDYSLKKKDVQDFMKRLRITLERKKLGHIRAFFACGEYGERKGRPHYHVLLLGWCPNDLQFHGMSYSGLPIYTSEFLESVWQKGFCPCGSVTSGSAAYVARYQKKGISEYKGRRHPPFFLTSRNIPLFENGLPSSKVGALGAQWVIDHHSDLRLGYVAHPSKPKVKCRIPEYYFDLLQKWFPDEYNQVKKYRYDFAMKKTKGFLIVDNQGEIDVVINEETPVSVLSSFLDHDLSGLHGSEILSLVRDNIRKQSAVQDLRLNRLKRNYE